MKRKKYLFLSLVLCSVFMLSACNSQKSVVEEEKVDIIEAKTIRITTPNAPNSIPLFYMKDNNVLGDNIELDVAIHKSSEEALAKIMKEEVDMANFGVQEAAKLYNKDVPVSLMNVNVWATYELLTTRDDIKEWSDLKGKTVWLGEKGGPIDFLTKVIIKENGIDDEKDLKIDRLATKELSQMVINDLKDIDVFILREPFISQVKSKNNKIKTAFNLGTEYERLFNKKIPQGGTVGTNNFLESNPQLATLFQEEYKKATKWVMDNPKEAGELGAKYMQEFKGLILESSIENMDMEYIGIEQAREVLEYYYKLAIEIDSTMLENELPDDNFYSGLK